MYQIGMCYYNQITTIDRDQSEAFKALKEFERLIARFPGSKFSVMAEKMVPDCKKAMGEQEFYVGEFYFKIKEYRAALRRFEKIAREYANVGLDDKVSRFIGETKRRIAETEAKKGAGGEEATIDRPLWDTTTQASSQLKTGEVFHEIGLTWLQAEKLNFHRIKLWKQAG